MLEPLIGENEQWNEGNSCHNRTENEPCYPSCTPEVTDALIQCLGRAVTTGIDRVARLSEVRLARNSPVKWKALGKLKTPAPTLALQILNTVAHADAFPSAPLDIIIQM